MRIGYAEQYNKACIILETGDELEDIIEKAELEDAIFYEGPDQEDKCYVVQFPERPMELYTKKALTDSINAHRWELT